MRWSQCRTVCRFGLVRSHAPLSELTTPGRTVTVIRSGKKQLDPTHSTLSLLPRHPARVTAASTGFMSSTGVHHCCERPQT